MLPDVAQPAGRTVAARLIDRVPEAWRAPLARLALAWLAVLAAFAPDWRDMALLWWDSSTYNHVLLVPAIIAWLVSLRVRQLAVLAPGPWWPALVPFGGGALLWLLGDASGLSVARHAGVVIMLQASVPAILGPRVAAGLLFPLAYMTFLVPVGDELVPALQTITASLAMALLGLVQLPAHLEGVFITTTFGYFEVAEACSGVKFLVAMIAYGALVANVCFRAWPRRIGFMALCLVVPVLANGARAAGTIIIARWQGIEFAAGFDHVFYGWVFFAVVMALVMAASWRFFDRAIDDPMIDADVLAASPVLGRMDAMAWRPAGVLGTGAGVLAIVLGWAAVSARLAAPLPAVIDLPAVPGWTRVADAPRHPWQPVHAGADHRLRGRYADRDGHVVDVSYALYAAQGEGREAGGFGQGAVPLGSAWAWEAAGPAIAQGRTERLQAPGPVRRVAVTFYRTGDLITGSNARLKLASLTDRMLLRARPTATLIVSAEEGQDADAQAAVAAFLAAAGPVPAWMDRIGGVR